MTRGRRSHLPVGHWAPVDHYQRLGVARDAPAGALRRAYRERMRALHPDHGGPGDGAAIAAVQEAWQVLRDPTARAAYDAALDGAPNHGGRPAATEPAMTGYVVASRTEERLRRLMLAFGAFTVLVVVAVVVLGFTQGPP